MPDPGNSRVEQQLVDTRGKRLYSSFVSALKLVKKQDEFEIYKHPLHCCTVITKNFQNLQLGGKACGLIELMEEGFPTIKEAVFVSNEVFDWMRPGNESHSEDLEQCAKILPAIKETMKLAGIRAFIAVRSSGFEDQISHTAAGVYETEFSHLKESDNELIKKLVTVSRSGISKKASRFATRMGVEPAPCPVILQQIFGQDETWENGTTNCYPGFSAFVDTSSPSHIHISLIEGLGTPLAKGLLGLGLRVSRTTGETEVLNKGRYRVNLKGIQIGDEFLIELDEYTDVDSWELSMLYDRLIEPILPLIDPLEARYDQLGLIGVALEIGLDYQNQIGKVTDLKIIQRRPVQKLLTNFDLKAPALEDDLLGASSAVIGQNTFTAQSCYYLKKTDSTEIDRLRDFNQQNPNGYLLFYVPVWGEWRESLEDFKQAVVEGICSNAKGVVLVDPVIHTSLETTSHYAHFFASEKLPILAINLQDRLHFTRNYRPALIRVLKNANRAFDFGRPVTLSVDQVVAKGNLFLT
ncbi:MAG: hypothetical protein KDD56_03190 [Bdellovibrionales bacterium]|nr:hypothetical protein [Bdellovibrionales bacterium]